MIRIGVIGAGYWGKKIIEGYLEASKKDPNIKLAGISDIQSDVLKTYKEKIPTLIVDTDYKNFLASPEIDAVHICTSNETHYKICKYALEKNKHVLLEKPMTLKHEDAYKLISIAENKNLILSVGHIFRFNNALLEVKKKIKEGYLGEIKHIRLQWSVLMKPPQGRDIIEDLGPHPFDILNYLLDDWPKSLACFTKSSDIAYIYSIFDDDITAHIELSWSTPGKMRRVSVIGSEKTCDCDCLSQKVTLYENYEPHEVEIMANDTIESELIHFAHSIINNGLKNGFEILNSGELGARTVELLELCKHSQSKQEWVNLEDDDAIRQTRYSVITDIRIGSDSRIYDQVNLYKCNIGKSTKIDSFVYIEEGVEIGNNCKVRPFTFIPTGVKIEDNVFIGPNVTFTNDKYPRAKGEWKLLPITIKKGASIGANSVILPGVTIGEKAMVGAGSVVTKDVPDYSIVAGNPARILKFVDEEAIPIDVRV